MDFFCKQINIIEMKRGCLKVRQCKDVVFVGIFLLMNLVARAQDGNAGINEAITQVSTPGNLIEHVGLF